MPIIETLPNFFEGEENTSFDILRLDLPDPISGGNKSFKLKYHLEEMRELKLNRILTFGGAFSNHIAAVAAEIKKLNIETVGIIRGDELNENSNQVLKFAKSCGMKLVFISRDEYRKKHEEQFLEKILDEYPDYYFIPEGGSGHLGMKGCKEILSTETEKYDIIFCAVGTGTTLAGIIASAKKNQEVVGVAVLQAKEQLEKHIRELIENETVEARWKLNSDFTFGGYGKSNQVLKNFITEIKTKFSLPLDPIYSAKTLFAIREMKNELAGKKILFVHTGGYAFT